MRFAHSVEKDCIACATVCAHFEPSPARNLTLVPGGCSHRSPCDRRRRASGAHVCAHGRGQWFLLFHALVQTYDGLVQTLLKTTKMPAQDAPFGFIRRACGTPCARTWEIETVPCLSTEQGLHYRFLVPVFFAVLVRRSPVSCRTMYNHSRCP